MNAPAASVSHRNSRLRTAMSAAATARRAWGRVDPDHITESWQEQVGPLTGALTSAQITAARSADSYVSRVLGNASSVAPVASVVPETFGGIASDGRSLTSLIRRPAIAALATISQGGTVEQAMTSGMVSAAMICSTQVLDAGRAADECATAARPRVVEYTRVVEDTACDRCVILAGQTYRWSEGFLRHPQCFPPGVVVSGPAARAATRRWYEGELVILSTADGEDLPVTGNHPVLTDRGWVPANLLQEGDYVVRSLLGQGAVPLVVPDEREVPSLIEDLWRSDGVVPFGQVPTTAEDFHGDGLDGYVDVVLTDRLLRDGRLPALAEPVRHQPLAFGVGGAALFASLRSELEFIQASLRSPNGFVGGPGEGPALLGGPLLVGGRLGFAESSTLDPRLAQMAFDGAASYPESLGNALLGLAAQIGGNDLGVGQPVSAPPRWDAPGLHRTREDRRANAERGLDLLGRLAGQVELDRVVEVRRVDFSGHVYNLDSSEGWYSANGLIVSNCACQTIPLNPDDVPEAGVSPRSVFDSMDEETQNRRFGRDQAEAIREGADPGQVVNARRGMQVTQDGRRVTTEGTTRRGHAGSRMGDFEGDGARARSRKARPMPEQIMRDNRDNREEAIAQLREYGYLD